MSIAAVCLFLGVAGGPAEAQPVPSLEALRREAERTLREFSDGIK